MTTPALTPGRVVRELFVSSRPVSWINTAFPFAAAYLLTTRQIDAPLIVGIIFFLVPYNLAMYGVNDVFDYESDLRNPVRAEPTAPCSPNACTPSRCGPRRCRACRSWCTS